MIEPKDFTKSGDFRSEMKTDRMKVPVVFHVQDELLPSESTLEQLESVASNDGLFRHIAAMADVHSKPGRKNATGTTIASGKLILPQVNDTDPACGMRLVATNLTEDNLSQEEIDRLFSALEGRVPTKAYTGTILPYRVIVDICRKGVRAAVEHLGIETKFEEEHSLDRGNFFGGEVTRKKIYEVIPRLFLFFAKFRSGILGAAGNHFLDLMKVTDLMDKEKAKRLGLRKGQYVFMIHCGSGILGQYTMYMYTAKKREHRSQAFMAWLGRMTFLTPRRHVVDAIAKKIRDFDFGAKKELFTFDGDGEDGRMYMEARNACSNFAHANRAIIAHNVSETIKEVLGRDPGFELIYDMPHILVSKENHYGSDVWVHRNGTSRAYGPSRMADHPDFRETGEPAFIPTSMSTEGYLCVGLDSNESTFFSCNHGAGKPKAAAESVVPQNHDELHAKLASRGVKLYNGRSSRVIEQDSAHYKNADAVIESVRQNGIVKPVAKLQPVAVIMY
ncbi:MAG: RtcB family protein [Candidatus Moranbacteria bacterium]|nr:RtcB family protein [Candidatus Moranbacteria bacterium]